MTDAMMQAGYAESTANQLQQVLGHLRNNGVLQEALRAIGFTEEFVAKELYKGATKLTPGKAHLG